jgi:RNA polymerase sigma-70 factor (ECF subfamily)
MVEGRWSVIVTEGHQHDVTSEDGLLSFYDAAFDDVYRSAARLVWGDRAVAEDLVQDAFVRLVRSIQSGAVTTVGIGWMITTVRRIHIDRLRAHDREGRRLRAVAGSPSQPPSSGTTEIVGLLDGLSDRERTALILRYVEDLSVADVADLMDSSTRATESLLQRAKQKVRDTRSAS